MSGRGRSTPRGDLLCLTCSALVEVATTVSDALFQLTAAESQENGGRLVRQGSLASLDLPHMS